MSGAVFDEVVESLRSQVEGFRALALVSLDGRVSERFIADPSMNSESLLEFATLLRIANHTSVDTRTGPLLETSWTSERSLVLARRISAGNFLILVGDPKLRLGLARYLLRRAVWQLRPELEGASR